jgi:hypothetical protein
MHFCASIQEYPATNGVSPLLIGTGTSFRPRRAGSMKLSGRPEYDTAKARSQEKANHD